MANIRLAVHLSPEDLKRVDAVQVQLTQDPFTAATGIRVDRGMVLRYLVRAGLESCTSRFITSKDSGVHITPVTVDD